VVKVVPMVVLFLALVAAAEPASAALPCLQQLEQDMDACDQLDGWFRRQLCYFEAGLRWEACLARYFL